MTHLSRRVGRRTTVHDIRLRVLFVSTAIAAGTFVGLVASTSAPADASTPRLHGACSVSEVGKFSYTASGQKVRCTSTGATGTKWVPVAR